MSDPQPQLPFWAAVPARRPRATLAVVALAAVVSGLLLFRLQPSGSLATMFPERYASARALAAVADRFAAADGLLIMISADGPGRTQALTGFAERLAAEIAADRSLDGLVESVRWRPSPEFRGFVERVVAPSLVYYLDDPGLDELKRRLSPQGIAEQLERNEAMVAAGGAAGEAMKLLLRDPLRLSELGMASLMPRGGAMANLAGESAQTSTDGRSLLIQVTAGRPVSDMDAVALTMEGVRAAVGRADPGELRVDYAGAFAIADIARRSIRSDMISSVTSSVVLMQVLFLLTYRGVLAFPLAFGPVALGVLAAFAFKAVSYPVLSPPTAVVGAVLAGLGIDYCVHYLSHYHASVDRGTAAVDAAAVSCDIGPSLLGACATSVIAFAALIFSDVAAMRDFALIGGVGLAACLLATLAVLPAVLTLIAGKRTERDRSWLWWTGRPLVRAVERNVGWSLALTVSLMAAALVFTAARWKTSDLIEPDLNAMHPQPNAALRTQSLIAQRFGGSVDPLFVYLTAGEDGDLVGLCHRARRALEDSPDVAGTVGLANLLPDPGRADRCRAVAESIEVGRVAADFRAAVDRSVFDVAAFEPYLSYLEGVLRPSPPPGLRELGEYRDLASQALARGGQREALTLVFLKDDLNERERRDRVIGDLEERLGPIGRATLTGVTVVARDAERSVYGDLSTLLTAAAGFVVLWLIGQFRNARDVIYTLLPVAFAGAAVTAAMVGGIRLNMVNLVALPLLIGLGVDYGIFLVGAARSVRRSGGGRDEFLGAVASSCHAIIIAAVTTVLGFGSLAFTSTPAIRSLGVLLAVGVGACLFATLFGLLPLLLRGFESEAAR